MAERHYPFELKPVAGEHSLAHVRNAIASLGSEGSPAIIGSGWVPADVLFPQTLILLATQPRETEADSSKQRDQSGKEQGSAVAGGVWVREQLTVHRPLPIAEPFTVSGGIVRFYSRKGRQYSVTASKTHSEQGELLVSSCTTGLVRYRPDPTLADAEAGCAEADLPVSGPDWTWASQNPVLGVLRTAREGDTFAGPTCEVTLEMMRERDGGRSANPIHTEPEEARRAGLTAPIAGGPHVFGFVQALLTRAFGPEVLLYGAHLSVRWRAPVHAGQSVTASARVSTVTPDRIAFDFEVEREGVIAMVGSAIVPLPTKAST